MTGTGALSLYFVSYFRTAFIVCTNFPLILLQHKIAISVIEIFIVQDYYIQRNVLQSGEPLERVTTIFDTHFF
jgi:hypothetical protein